MKKIKHIIEIEDYQSFDELNTSDRELLNKAQIACKSAYAPYSQFRVGAAVLLENGKIVTGNNQENAAYPSGLCAERVAMYYASANYPNTPMLAIAIAVDSDQIKFTAPLAPCGSCRQVMAEYEHLYKLKMRVILSEPGGKVQIINGISDLLPLTFNAKELKGI
ncbi:MAG: cytidine deaminase [Bacteroidales bacterium]|nr:cytidine deaminase [Bacteroidales bacterium]RLD38927.1 MAG: cytidine deaminase [Bacteroidota bacterium]